ncbi:HAL/PAL/TAL family ammonia-lyase [Polluticaenibacter yanchengensis]|uniref:Aromatic amino acid ammonia-lyase n=1 Tax=Polluticaenibacter yanchengensis TaxID=3014562 RepID=A0ABT4UJ44_9BACT|nr:aromatic amino acid ammonia-lyase [Chitinophagaceae bacterium LY-5]
MKVIEGYLNIADFEAIVFHGNKVGLNEKVSKKIEDSFEFLKSFSSNKIIYGVNTGFGPMAQYRIDDDKRIQLQYNLIRSHASGIGEPLSAIQVKAAILARLNSVSLGYSGIHPSVVALMQELINRDITPLIFSHGGVGASGDLVQLAHLALVLIGEGEVFYKGERRPTAEVFEIEELKPVNIEIREGLSIINGTSVMTGIGLVNVVNAKKLIDWSLAISCMITEMVAAYDDHISEELNAVKLHNGQSEVAKRMRTHLADSQLIRKRDEHLYSGENSEKVFKDKVQEYYSIRCVPQITGAILETVISVESVLEKELNSANDNPIIDVDSQHVFHGGNFHGDYVSLEMDKLKIVITKLTMLAERQLNYLLNAKINEMLPPFVNLGELGFNFGMQGAQFTATSTTAESQTLSNPMYVHSIPNNNDNQDIVSMGTNSALIADKVIENAFQVLSVQLITVVQAIEALGCKEKVSGKTRKIYDEVRTFVPAFKEDMVMYPLIQNVKSYLSK